MGQWWEKRRADVNQGVIQHTQTTALQQRLPMVPSSPRRLIVPSQPLQEAIGILQSSVLLSWMPVKVDVLSKHCVCVGGGGRWRAEDTLRKSVLSFHHLSPRVVNAGWQVWQAAGTFPASLVRKCFETMFTHWSSPNVQPHLHNLHVVFTQRLSSINVIILVLMFPPDLQ